MNAWTKAQKTMVLTIYGLVVGLVLIGAGVFVVLPHMLESAGPDGIRTLDIALLSGFLVGGFVIAMPTISMQVIGRIVTAWSEWRGSS